MSSRSMASSARTVATNACPCGDVGGYRARLASTESRFPRRRSSTASRTDAPSTGGHDEPVDGAEDRLRLLPSSEHHEGFGAVLSGGAEADHAQRCGLVQGVERRRGRSLVAACGDHHVGVVRPRSQHEVGVFDLLGDRDGLFDRFDRGDEVAPLRQVRTDRRQGLPLDHPCSRPPGELEGAVGEAVAVEDPADAHVHPRLGADDQGLRSDVVGGRELVGDPVEHRERPLFEPDAGWLRARTWSPRLRSLPAPRSDRGSRALARPAPWRDRTRRRRTRPRRRRRR